MLVRRAAGLLPPGIRTNGTRPARHGTTPPRLRDRHALLNSRQCQNSPTLSRSRSTNRCQNPSACAVTGHRQSHHLPAHRLIHQPGGSRIEDHLATVREQVTVSIDPYVRPHLVPPAANRERLHRWCSLTDILRLSDDDLALLLPEATPERACDTWHAAGARLVVITRGSYGALASLDGHRVTVPTPPVDVIDTVGAREAFTAGLLHRLADLGRLGGRLDGLSLEDLTDACTFAAHVATLTCSVPGTEPPIADEASCGVSLPATHPPGPSHPSRSP
ncbi:carbohydrate kinase family protein [Streptomyces shenzhenensis]|uniref:carbohydrate kinase family protein n=1 Tax=Streptomyces shenzhenensis TaxID=943815 RepID=UPI0034096084